MPDGDRHNNTEGFQALHQNVILNKYDGNAVKTRGTVSKTATDLEIEVSNFEVLVNGSEFSPGTNTVQIRGGDSQPRKDVIYYDSNGALQVEEGTPENVVPVGTSGFGTARPMPPDLDDKEAAVIAVVDVPANASTNSDISIRERWVLADAVVDELDVRGGISEGTTVVYDPASSEIPQPRLGGAASSLTGYPLPNSDLANSSITVNAGDGLKNAGSVALGASVTIDVEPADFAGSFLSDDGTDDLAVNLGTGLQGDGNDNIEVDEVNVDHDQLQNFVANEHVDHSTVNISAGNALTGGGDITASRTIDVASNGIGTDELDESASFDFSSQIDFSGGIGNSGSLLSINDSVSIPNGNSLTLTNNSFTKALILENSAGTTSQGLVFRNDSGTVFESSMRSNDGNLNIRTEDGGASLTDRVRVTSGSAIAELRLVNTDFNVNNNNIDDVASIDGGGNPVDVADKINLTASIRAIQSDGTDALNFDTSQNLFVTNGRLELQGGDLNMNQQGQVTDATQINTYDSANSSPSINIYDSGKISQNSSRQFNIRQTDAQPLSLEQSGGGNIRLQTNNSGGVRTTRISLTGGVDTGTVNIENANLDIQNNILTGSNGQLDFILANTILRNDNGGGILQQTNDSGSNPTNRMKITGGADIADLNIVDTELNYDATASDFRSNLLIKRNGNTKLNIGAGQVNIESANFDLNGNSIINVRSSGTALAAGDLSNGEIAMDEANGRLIWKDGSGSAYYVSGTTL